MEAREESELDNCHVMLACPGDVFWVPPKLLDCIMLRWRGLMRRSSAALGEQSHGGQMSVELDPRQSLAAGVYGGEKDRGALDCDVSSSSVLAGLSVQTHRLVGGDLRTSKYQGANCVGNCGIATVSTWGFSW